MIEDNSMKAITAYSKINIAEDYGDVKEENNPQNEYMHIAIRRSQRKRD